MKENSEAVPVRVRDALLVVDGEDVSVFDSSCALAPAAARHSSQMALESMSVAVQTTPNSLPCYFTKSMRERQHGRAPRRQKMSSKPPKSGPLRLPNSLSIMAPAAPKAALLTPFSYSR